MRVISTIKCLCFSIEKDQDGADMLQTQLLSGPVRTTAGAGAGKRMSIQALDAKPDGSEVRGEKGLRRGFSTFA